MLDVRGCHLAASFLCRHICICLPASQFEEGRVCDSLCMATQFAAGAILELIALIE